MENQKGLAPLFIVMVVAFLAVIGLALYFSITANISFTGSQQQSQNQNSDQQQNTQPPVDETASWNTLRNDEFGFELKYPNNFFDAGHEPKISYKFEGCNGNTFPSQCPSLVTDYSENNPVGSLIMINNNPYCYYQRTDAATGHQYYYDFYLTVKDQKCMVVELATSTTTCENYLPLEQGNVEQEQNYNTCVTQRNNRPGILQQIINTFKFTSTP